MQDTFSCPKCSSHNTIGAPSCQACGENFKYTCPHCGIIVDTEFKKCSECGATLYWPIHDQAKPPPAGRKRTHQEQENTSETASPKQKRRSPILIVGLTIIGTSILAAIVMQALFQGTPFTIGPNSSSPTPETTPATTEAIEITADELLQAYRKDKKAAEGEYKGKILNVTGTVGSINKNVVGTLFVKLAGNSIEAWRVQCMFDKEYELDIQC